MDESDWKIGWQNTDAKTTKCVSHKDCARKMKVVRSKDQTGGMIYMRGSHSTTVSDEPFIGKGKNAIMASIQYCIICSVGVMLLIKFNHFCMGRRISTGIGGGLSS
mmetsp:Transcript_4808/g.7297  ORF Transcript_4808/g.7297 Transcript_4808/m.7297 type:complete len:106 (+) Transcript_4808:939-1256(+)